MCMVSDVDDLIKLIEPNVTVDEISINVYIYT